MRTPAGSLCKAVARYFCARPLGPFAKQECAFLRAPAGSFCKAGVRFFCARPPGRFAKQWRAIFAHARWVLLQSRSALFLRTPAGSLCKAVARYFCARPTGRFCKTGARLLRPTGRRSSPFVRRPRASIHRPQRPALPPACPTRAHASFPLVMAPFPQPLHALPSARAHSPLRPSPSARAHSPFRFFRFPRPAPPSSALPYRAPGRCARLPLRRPSFPAPFPDTARLHRKGKRCPHQCGAPRGIPARAAGLTRRGCGPRLPCLHRSILRPDARGKGRGWRRNGRCRA